jgi:ribonuclease VapC
VTVVDTSAVVALLFGEPGSDEIERKLTETSCVMSAPTRVELGIVIEAKKGPAGTQLLEELLARVGCEVVPMDADLADAAIVCWRRFGKGRHEAGLNLGDTFSYALARSVHEPLLFVGHDFSETDISVA